MVEITGRGVPSLIGMAKLQPGINDLATVNPESPRRRA